MTTVETTIAEAAEKYGVAVADILAGQRCRNAHVVCAREWVIGQHPDVSDNELSKALGYAQHSSVTYARRRLKKTPIHNTAPT